MIRSFDWRDIPTLYRYRKRGLYMSTMLMATRGSLLIPGVVASYLTAASGVFTSVCTQDGSKPVMGQIVHLAGSTLARMSFLAPKDELEIRLLPGLFEHLTKQAGDRGAYNIIVDIDELDPVFESLRRAGLTVYTRQRVYLFDEYQEEDRRKTWQPAMESDRIPIKSLHANLVPGMVQQIEPLNKDIFQGMVCWDDGSLLGYVSIEYGPRGIWVQPYIHPDVDGIDELLVDMLRSIPDRRSRPVYICVRNYQSWLESSMDRLGGKPGEQQAVLVKRMALTQKVVQTFKLRQIEGNPDASIAHIENFTDEEAEVTGHNQPSRESLGHT
jgi:hypothetical protein